MASAKRLDRSGELLMVSKNPFAGASAVPFANAKPVCDGSSDPGHLTMASTTRVLDGHMSYSTTSVQCRTGADSASSLESALCATMPFSGSSKMRLAMANRSSLRTSDSLSPHRRASSLNEIRSSNASFSAIRKRFIASRLVQTLI